jgi:hypothetical protein
MTHGDPATDLGAPTVMWDSTDGMGATGAKGRLTPASANGTPAVTGRTQPAAGGGAPPATARSTGASKAATAGSTAASGAVAPGGKPRPPAAEADLIPALGNVRQAIADTAYPLVLPSADEARRVAGALAAQLDDYLLPRLARLDAPLLVVVGGSTGAGRSTLVNSLVKARASAVGVLRPTTRSPVLVCNPADLAWYQQGELLPGLIRTANPSERPDTLQLIAAPALAAGLALLDAPDIDSVVDANRALAGQLLAAADLWLFVTTAARYADAVPWDLLHTARLRGTAVALVLDRVPPEAGNEVTAHLSEMLVAQGLGAVPLFVLPETSTDGQGLLPEPVTADLRTWFGWLASDAEPRANLVRQTLDGALAALAPVVEGLAGAADDQATAIRVLEERIHAAYRGGRRSVQRGIQDGRMLRGEAFARSQKSGTGEFLRGVKARIGRLRDRLVAAFTGRSAPSEQVRHSVESQLVTLLQAAAAEAAESAYAGWQSHPAGAALLEPSLARPSDGLPERAVRLVRDWQRGVREDLLDLLDELLGEEAGRYLARLDSAGVQTDASTRLRDAAHRVEQARVKAALAQATGSGLSRTAS